VKAGIVGAGIMGRLLAFSLDNAGWQVSLFDKDDESGNESCSMVAAGLLTPVAELDKSDPIIFNLGHDALTTHWPKIINTLSDPIYFQQQGSLLLAHPRDHAELSRFIKIIASKYDSCFPHPSPLSQKKTGGEGKPMKSCINTQSFQRKLESSSFQKCFQELTHAEITSLEPELTKFNTGYYFPQEGQLDNQALLNALYSHLVKKNIRWQKKTLVHALKKNKIYLQDSIEEFDMVFDCRGLGAKSQFNDLRGVRGELIWLHAPEVNIQRPLRFLHPRYSLYVVPRPHHTYIVGASEIESEDTSNISVQTTLELLSAAYYLHPGFAEARIIKSLSQCRPTLADHLPKIKCADGSIAVNGLYRHGFLIAPTLAAEIVNYVTQGSTFIQYPQLWEQQ
jgi:glycine oxidase